MPHSIKNCDVNSIVTCKHKASSSNYFTRVLVFWKKTFNMCKFYMNIVARVEIRAHTQAQWVLLIRIGRDYTWSAQTADDYLHEYIYIKQKFIAMIGKQ